MTGDLKYWERDNFKTYIEMLGHKMVGTMSRKVDFLITNTPNSGTIKNKKAAELGIRIITEDQAITELGLTKPAAGATAQTSLSADATVMSGTFDDL